MRGIRWGLRLALAALAPSSRSLRLNGKIEVVAKGSARLAVLFAIAGALALAGAGAACSYPDPNGDDLAACPSCDLPIRAPGADASGDAPPSSDSGRPADSGAPKSPTCSSLTPFGAPTLLPGLDPDRHASSPHTTPDELAIYFTSTDPDLGAQIYRATRAKKDDPFGNVEPVPVINSASNDNDPTISSDGLTLVFHSGRSGNNDVWWSKRDTVASAFGPPEAVPGVATANYDGQGFYSVIADELWFVSNRDGTYDIFRSKRSGGAFANATPVTELNTAQDDFLPWLSADGKTIYWSSTREGGQGGQDLYLATRADTNSAFGSPQPLSELNTAVTEQAGSLSLDNCRIYFSRVGGAGGQQIFVASRPLPP